MLGLATVSTVPSGSRDTSDIVKMSLWRSRLRKALERCQVAPQLPFHDSPGAVCSPDKHGKAHPRSGEFRE